MNKKGQFFLIAALVMIAIFIGLGAIYTSSRVSREDLTTYDLSKEINFEASQVVNTGILSGLTSTQIIGKVKSLSDVYSQANQESDFLLVYGNTTELNVFYYNNTETGQIGLSTGTDSYPTLTLHARDVTVVTQNNQQSLKVILPSNISYDFNITSGQTFYIIIKKERGDEQIVAHQ